MTTSRTAGKGQRTTSNEVREHVQPDTGDSSEAMACKRGTVRALRGLLHRPGAAASTLAEAREGMLELLAHEDLRIRRGLQ